MIKNLTMLCLGALLLGACTKDLETPLTSAGQGERVSSRFVLRAQTPGQISTRAVDDNAIANLWVAQCVGGTVSGTPTYLASNINLNDVAVELAASNGTVYFFANTNDPALFTGVTTEEQVQALSATFTYDATTTTLPMYGQWSGTPVEGIITTPVSLYRAVTKVTFNLSSELPTSLGLKLQKVQLKRTPKKVTLARSQESLNTGVYPAAVADDFTDLPASFDNAAGEVLTEKTFTWYLAENHRGTGTAQSQKNKTAATAPAGQGDYCTYVELVFDTNSDNYGEKLVYRIWLGGNNYNDYNLQRNTHYTVSTRLLGINQTDTRITEEINEFFIGAGGTIAGNATSGYRFTKATYEAETESETSIMSGSNNGETTSRLDGKSNTLSICRFPGNSGAKVCLALNDGYESITAVNDSRFEWFLPSIYQGYLMTLTKGYTVNDYMTSSMFTDANNYRLFLCCESGRIEPRTANAYPAVVRCVKEKDEPNFQPFLYKESGAIIIDFSVKTGFPPRLVELQKGKKIPAGEPTTDNLLENNKLDDSINATVYQKLEIASVDESLDMNWVTAYTTCRNKGTGWRLPTLRELELICCFVEQIVSLGGENFGDTAQVFHWAVTEWTYTDAYSFTERGFMYHGSPKTDTRKVRCVREI